MNNELNNNQHFITRSFIKKRFGNAEGFVLRYDVQHGTWKTNASPKIVFTRYGYTQFLEQGQPVDNSLEDSFANLESKLEFILAALDNAAANESTPIPDELFKDFCFYCAYLSYLSPFAKAKAPVDFVATLDIHLPYDPLECGYAFLASPFDQIRSATKR
jgi:hypothetical protein